MSAVALLIRQAWQNGLVPGSVATLLDERRILKEEQALVSAVGPSQQLVRQHALKSSEGSLNSQNAPQLI